MLTGANFIGARNPATGKAPAFAEATPAEVDEAARAAESAFEADAGLPPARRAALLRVFSMVRGGRRTSARPSPDAALPEELRDANPRGLWRLGDGRLTQHAL